MLARTAFALLVVIAACRHAEPDGGERGPCYGNHTCDPGLACLSDLCVRAPGVASAGSGGGSGVVAPPGPGDADCAAIADHLGGLLLGNYAPRDERASFAATMVTQCRAAGLDRADERCLLAARSRQDLGACPHPLGVGDCAAIVAHLRALPAGAGADQYLVTSADRLISRCKNEVPSKALETCALAAQSMTEVDRCAW
jgi:hypothetical protein